MSTLHAIKIAEMRLELVGCVPAEKAFQEISGYVVNLNINEQASCNVLVVFPPCCEQRIESSPSSLPPLWIHKQ